MARVGHRFSSLRGLVQVLAGTSLLLALALSTSGVQAHVAHAAYVRSDPPASSVRKTDPTVVTIWFAQNLSPQGLSIVVYGNKADVVSTGSAQILSSDPKAASVTMKGDGSDIYRVDWNNVSAEDGDPTLGAFVFAVDPSGTSDKVVPTQPTTSTTVSSGVAPWVAVLIGLAGLVVGAAVTYVVSRPRTAK